MHRCKATMRGTKYINSTITIYYLEILEKHHWWEMRFQCSQSLTTILVFLQISYWN